MSKQTKKRLVYINSWAMNSALGDNKSTAKQRLSQGVSEDMCLETGWLNDGKTTVVGKVTSRLPVIEGKFNTRNNQIALSVLLQIEEEIKSTVQRYGKDRIAVVVATSTSGISDGESAIAKKQQVGEFPESYHYQQQELGNLGEFVAQHFNIEGPVYTISTACSSSGRVFLSAKRLLNAGLVDAVIVGGADSLCKLTLNGFHGLEALSTTHCNPFSENRNGINIGEAAAFMLLSNEKNNISNNNNNSLALLGAGDSSDAHHISAPHPEGKGAIEAMLNALDDAQLLAEDIGYINAHGTATALNDAMEAKAIYQIFSNRVPVSSTKPFTGHALGTASIIEAAIICLLLEEDIDLPKQVNDGRVDKTLAPILLVKAGQKLAKRAVLSNSFAFGGNNVSIILGADNE
ncbi:beta-ketoacyl-[acyl-carrier-protein] synthase family protein [Psychromonas sp.]|uniref:beta-ketoacyl-[acyl-carrier-protein] synthase family protein n=1 Tax=Psychromonas sp. TaxID=1884585 RepID=UPI00356205A2